MNFIAFGENFGVNNLFHRCVDTKLLHPIFIPMLTMDLNANNECLECYAVMV